MSTPKSSKPMTSTPVQPPVRLADVIARRIVKQIHIAEQNEELGQALLDLLTLTWRINSGEIVFPKLSDHPAVSAAMDAVRKWQATEPGS